MNYLLRSARWIADNVIAPRELICVASLILTWAYLNLPSWLLKSVAGIITLRLIGVIISYILPDREEEEEEEDDGSPEESTDTPGEAISEWLIWAMAAISWLVCAVLRDTNLVVLSNAAGLIAVLSTACLITVLIPQPNR